MTAVQATYLATPVTFTLTPVAPGTTITRTATTSGGGVGGTLTACVTLSNVPVNVYDVGISVGGNNYLSRPAVLAIFDPSLGFVTAAEPSLTTACTPHSGSTSNTRGAAPQGEFLTSNAARPAR